MQPLGVLFSSAAFIGEAKIAEICLLFRKLHDYIYDSNF